MIPLSAKYKQSFTQATMLAVPIITGQLGMILMGFFDTIQIGGLGSDYIAASGVANNVYWLVTLLGLGILFSISPLVSEAFGEGNKWKAIGVFRAGIKVAFITGMLFTALMIAAVYWFDSIGQDPAITLKAKKFLFVLNFTTPALFLFTAGKQLLDGMGRTTVGMYINLIGLGCNVFLNWVLIYGHCGLPALGIIGAAIATGTSRTLMMIAVFIFIYRDKEINELHRQFLESEAHTRDFTAPILRIGIPYGLQMFWEVGAFGVAQIMSGWLGVNYLAAFQIAISLASVTFMAVTGISTAGTILTGFAFGAKDREGIRVAANTVFVMTLVAEIIFAIFFFAFHGLLPKLYTDDAVVISIASSLVIFAAFFQISDGFQSVAAGVLLGIQDVKVSSIMAFISYWIVMVPLCYLLAFKFGVGISGIWIGIIIGLTIAAILLLFRFQYKLKRVVFEDL